MEICLEQAPDSTDHCPSANNVYYSESETSKELTPFRSSDTVSETSCTDPIVDFNETETVSISTQGSQDNETDAEENVSKKRKSKRIIDDSDSEDDGNENKLSDKENRPLNAISDSDTEADVALQSQNLELPDINIRKSQLANICDSESEDEKAEDSNLFENDNVKLTPSPYKKAKKFEAKLSSAAYDPKKMTPKEAALQRKEIQSESQRMLREKNVSLPYHKPKSRTLKEFLARRPKLSRALPEDVRAPPCVAIKMTEKQLEIVTQKLEQREKEVKEFYKSESESESESEENPKGVDNLAEEEKVEEEKESTIDEVDRNAVNGALFDKESADLEENIVEAENGEVANEIQETVPESELNNSSKNVSSSNLSHSGSELYEFNLDNMNESEDKTNEPNSVKTFQKPPLEPQSLETTKFTYTDIDREIENFEPDKNTDSVLEEPPTPIKSKLELLKEKLANDKPKLTAGPDDVVDLDSDLTKPREVMELMERFAKHVAAKKHQPHHKVKLNIVTVESGGDIHNEEVAMQVDSEDELIEEKPGAKLQKLKVELQRQMEQKKAELWQHRASAVKNDGQNDNEEESGCKDILDDDEEEESDLTDEDEEEYEEIEDIEREKPRKKSQFLDEEAEVSGSEDEVNEESDEEREKADEIQENKEKDHGEESNEVSDESNENSSEKRVLKRVIKPADDSDEEDELFDDSVHQKSTTNDVHLDSTVTADEDDIPSHQPPQLQTPVKAFESQAKSLSDFLTPISFITGIQSLNTAPKTNLVSPFRMPTNGGSPNKTTTPKQLLFGSSEESSLLTQPSLTESTQMENDQEMEPNTQELLGICSGQFTGVTQLSSDPALTSDSSEIKALVNDDDMIISQLLDEEELEIFKKKFESPVEEIVGGAVIDSDEESETIGVLKKRKKTGTQQKIQFSEDESSDDDESSNDKEEEIDLNDEDFDNIGYDSEENEIELNDGAPKLKLADFVEKEAELSGSDWDSEDEDEKGLDRLEFELGDTDKFDEAKMKSDLEKIHMRRILDDDTREVKLLQELLLEDGEMHGTGRQRQFKWKNIDLNNDNNEERKDDDDIYLDEEENEEQWRKNRHEREMFLKKHQQKSSSLTSNEDILGDSQLLKIGQKIIERSVSYQSNTPNEKNEEDFFETTPLNLQSKRGSFLNRNDQVLQRVAEYTSKETVEVDIINSKKTTKHFLFQSASMMEVSAGSIENKKRKASENTPNVLKKLRLNANLSPAVRKMLGKQGKSKKSLNFVSTQN